jgi:hypothetical protein
MKVGAISLMTAFLLALPLAAFGGADPCPETGDVDGDTICNDVDNCKDTSNVAQGDLDGDGQGDVCDNCISHANGPNTGLPLYPGLKAGVRTPGLQCDTNDDGYGNACDVDIDNAPPFLSTSGDYTGFFFPAVSAGIPPAFVWVGNIPGGTLNGHSSAQEVDMDCNNFKNSIDYTTYFQPRAQLGPFMAGRSGITVGLPGCCPPHN